MVWGAFFGSEHPSEARKPYVFLWFFDGDFRVLHFAFRSNFSAAHSTSEKIKNASLESLCFKWFGGCRNGPRDLLRCIPSYESPRRRATILQSEILSVAPGRSKFPLCKIDVQKPYDFLSQMDDFWVKSPFWPPFDTGNHVVSERRFRKVKYWA